MTIELSELDSLLLEVLGVQFIENTPAEAVVARHEVCQLIKQAWSHNTAANETTLARLANAETALVFAEQERDEARAQVKRAASLLPKWGSSASEYTKFTMTHKVYIACWNDLSAALAVPETPAQAAERLADHADEQLLDLMQQADLEGAEGD